MAPMLPIDDVVKMTSQADLDAQVLVRLDVLKQMVGSLYPGIVVNELDRIWQRQRELRATNNG